MEEKQTIKTLTWSDLIALRSYFASLLAECMDKNGICLISKFKVAPVYEAEIKRLDTYIQAKYEKVKSDSKK